MAVTYDEYGNPINALPRMDMGDPAGQRGAAGVNEYLMMQQPQRLSRPVAGQGPIVQSRPAPMLGSPPALSGPTTYEQGMIREPTQQQATMRIDPKRALWAGTIMDIGNYIGSKGRRPMQGLGPQMMMQANEWNRDQRMDAESQRRYEEALELRKQQLTPQSVREYQFAVNQGSFTGTFEDWVDESARQSVSPTGDIQEYNLAVQQGYDGTFMEYQEAKRPSTAAEREYQKAVEQGYTGTIWEYDADQRAEIETRKAEAQAQIAARQNIPGQISLQRGYVTGLRELRDDLAELGTGPVSGRTEQYYNERFQAVQARVAQVGLENIAALAEKGVRLNPITENELRLLLSTGPQMTNLPEANVKILDDWIERAEKSIRELERQLKWVDQGNNILDYRPTESWLDPEAVNTSGVTGLTFDE